MHFSTLFLLIILTNHPGSEVNGAKILMMSPSLSKSIMLSTGRISDVLVKAGHEVTFWIPEMVRFNSGYNGTRLSQRIIRMSNLSPAFEQWILEFGDLFEAPNLVSKVKARFYQLQSIAAFSESILQRIDELDELKQMHFDLAISDMIEPFLIGISHHLGITKHIWISTGEIPDNVNWLLGIPQPLSVVPTLQDAFVGGELTLFQRFENIYTYAYGKIIEYFAAKKMNDAFKRYISPKFPSLDELARQVALCFVIGDEFLNPSYPIVSKVVYVGGAGLKTPDPVPDPFSKVMERGADAGVVLFSFGTASNTNKLGHGKLLSLYNAFASFPRYQFVVKVSDGDVFSENATKKIANIYLTNWLPQNELLADERVKLHITHCGYNSILESAIHGVPTICIPLFFDQFRNAKTVEFRGIGLTLDRSQITQKNVENAINRVLKDERYQQNANRLAKLIAEKPNQPDEMVVKWTNFVLENGPLPELIPLTAQIHWTRYFCLDLLLIAALITFIVGRFLRAIFRRKTKSFATINGKQVKRKRL